MKPLLILNLLLASLSLILSPFSSAARQVSDHYQLEKVVMLIRHGVRAPTNTPALNKATGKIWPQWNVPDGFLTGHGYAGILAQGSYQLTQWRELGLPLASHAGCPAADQVWLWAAPDQRTKATGAALLDGMFPGCGMVVHSTTGKHDPLFDTMAMGIARPDENKVIQQVKERLGSPAQARTTYANAVTDLRKAVCHTDEKNCKFPDSDWGVEINNKGKIKLTGPVAGGAAIGETIRLQYSENLPLSQVAFGHARNAQQVSNLMALHAAKYDLLSDTPEYASHGGSLLMRQLVAAITARSQSPSPLTEKPYLQSPLVIMVGHDTNIAQIQTMLGFNWQLPGYPHNDIPPGGSLITERYLDKKTGEHFIHLIFAARTLDQWRRLSPLNARNPLPVAEFKNPDCHETSVGELCPIKTFVRLAEKNLVNDGNNLPVFE